MAAEDSPIYRDLMRFKPDGWTANAWAVNAGVSRTVWTDMRRHGNPSRRTLGKLLVAAGSSLAEFEALRIGEQPASAQGAGLALSDSSAQRWRPAPSTLLPLVASSASEPMEVDGKRIDATDLGLGDILEHLPRPPSLSADPGAYALTIVSNAMWPRFRPGRRIAVSPAAPLVPGDDVIVVLSCNRASGRSVILIAELVHRTGSEIELRQFSPDATYRVPAASVRAIHKVMGELI